MSRKEWKKSEKRRHPIRRRLFFFSTSTTSSKPYLSLSLSLSANSSSPSGSGAAGIGSGFFGDVLAEARLIEWPSLKQALGDTVLVVGIVLGSALLLFVVNTLLADLSKVIY